MRLQVISKIKGRAEVIVFGHRGRHGIGPLFPETRRRLRQAEPGLFPADAVGACSVTGQFAEPVGLVLADARMKGRDRRIVPRVAIEHVEETLVVAVDDVAEVDTTRAKLASRLILDQALTVRLVQDSFDAR